MILVTGGTGLVGSHLLLSLSKEKHAVRAIYRTEESLQKVKNVFAFFSEESDKLMNAINWVKADITDIASLEDVFVDVTQVYHCAALISFKAKDYINLRRVNIHGTANVVNFCVSHKVKKLCFVSSIAAVGDDEKKMIADEDNDWNGNENNHGYAITKYGAEMEVWRGAQEGIDTVIVNPGVILGGGFWNSGSGELFNQVYKGLKYYTKGGSGFVCIHDVVSAMKALMNSKVKNERFILVGENKSYDAVLFEIADAFGKRRPSIYIKPWVTNLVWRLENMISVLGRTPKITKHSARSMHSVTKYSSEKIKEALDFKFTPISESIQAIVKMYPRD